jgi:hypothetical protein
LAAAVPGCRAPRVEPTKKSSPEPVDGAGLQEVYMHNHHTNGAAVAQPFGPLWHAAWDAIGTQDPAAMYAALQALNLHHGPEDQSVLDVLRILSREHALRLYEDDPARAKITRKHRERAGDWITGGLRTLMHCYLDGRPVAPQAAAVRNLRTFLDRFPRLTIADRAHCARHLAGRGCPDTESLPGSDHTAFWRVPGRGVIAATTFPYHWCDDTDAAARVFAARYGLRLEVQPPDVPDMYFPGSTVPVVWSRAGVDWRAA